MHIPPTSLQIIKHLLLKESKPLSCSTAQHSTSGRIFLEKGRVGDLRAHNKDPAPASLSLLACSPSDARSVQGPTNKTSSGLWQKSIPLVADSPFAVGCSGWPVVPLPRAVLVALQGLSASGCACSGPTTRGFLQLPVKCSLKLHHVG